MQKGQFLVSILENDKASLISKEWGILRLASY
ncbi:hypothetical protein NC652_016271 [Populus alba x Populus x berolinensis]|uniref:Uncharacterized protein n=1 Tax=Populus alba x Populus x berolinensis TaxID=444605 RepID=A0AAD6QMC8_9ROSI|nr:hypothetical protein NC652_016271 [Populus alba x Populus x berolinensis]KAJ6993055.1 hypothetical protein NC653_016244 [Populus alba x Populus x berolinensis]